MKFPLIILKWLVVVCILAAAAAFSQTHEKPISDSDAQFLEEKAARLKLEWNRQALQNSKQLRLKALEIRRQTGNSAKVIENFRQIGKLEMILGEKKEADFSFNQALKLAETSGNQIEKAKILSEFVLLALADEKVAASEKYLKQALAVSEQTADASAQAAAFFSASQFYYVPDSSKSVKYLQKSVELWKSAGDLEGEATALYKLSYVYIDFWDYASAREVLNSALSKWETLGDLRGQAFTLRAMATVLGVSNEKQKALEYLNKAEQLIPKDIDFFEQAGVYNSYGYIYESYGDLNLSLTYRQKAFELYKTDRHLYGQLATTVSLCRLNSLLGNDAAALECLTNGESLAKSVGDSFYLTLLQEESGNYYLLRNDFQNAKLNYEKALQYFEKKNNHRQISQITAKLGMLFERKGNLTAAEKYFQQSLKLNRKVKDVFSETETLFHLSKIFALRGENETATELIEQSINLTEQLYSDVINSKLKKTYFSNVFDRYELYINLLMKRHQQFPAEGFDRQALQASEKSRARSMLETLSLAEISVAKNADPELVRRENEICNLLNLKATQITDLYNTNSSKQEIEKITAEMNVLAHRLEEIKTALKQKSPLYATIKNPSPFDVAAFQNRVLDNQTLLLEFSLGTEASYLWVIGKNEISFFRLPAREQIETHLQKLLSMLTVHQSQPNESVADYQARNSRAEKDYSREAQIFSDLIFGQLAERIAGKRLIIVPDGKLRYFPISALPLPYSNNGEPILLSNEIIYAPSASTLMLLTEQSAETSNSKKNLMVFADPVFTNKDLRLTKNADDVEETISTAAALNFFRTSESLNALPRLRASKDEANSIIEIVGGSSDLASGFNATRELVLNPEISQYRIVHFATHGILDEIRPELSSLILSRFDEQGNEKNGLIRLNDIYRLNLNAELVVLSACNTGIGKEIKGEGLMSLDNAFLQTGAKSVVSSLWKVDDYAAQELMKSFYAELAVGDITTSEALRRAQIKMRSLSQYKSPFYWAAFTIKGDFKASPQIKKDGLRSFYLIGLLPVLLVAIYIFRRFSFNSKTIKNR